MGISRTTGLGMTILSSKRMIDSPSSFYTLKGESNTGIPISFENFAGKKVLIVNLASRCGFTPQYKELQSLQDQFRDKLIILGCPSNDFGGQEPGTDEEIATFCEVNFRTTFPLLKKASVKGDEKQLVYAWLTNPSLNGWNNHEPSWNFCKYLVNERGQLVNFYSSSVSPLSELVIKSIAS